MVGGPRGAGGYDSDGWYWGLRWAGDQQTTLRSYLTGGSGIIPSGYGMLQISGTGLSPALQSGSSAGFVTYDAGSNKTYVGITVFGGTQTVNMANVAGSLLKLNNNNRSVGGLQGLAGSVVELGTGTLTLGANNTATSFAGVITGSTGAGALTKVGTGSLALGGANTYAGPTTVSAGLLAVNGSLGAGVVSVAACRRTVSTRAGSSWTTRPGREACWPTGWAAPRSRITCGATAAVG